MDKLTAHDAHELRMKLCGIDIGHAPGPFQWALRCAVFGTPVRHDFRNYRMAAKEDAIQYARKRFLDSEKAEEIKKAAQEIVSTDREITAYLMDGGE